MVVPESYKITDRSGLVQDSNFTPSFPCAVNAAGGPEARRCCPRILPPKTKAATHLNQVASHDEVCWVLMGNALDGELLDDREALGKSVASA